MATGLYKQTTKFVNGERIHVRVELTSREVKAYIMKINRISSAEYKRQYDIFKNKLRAYEAFEKNQERKLKSKALFKFFINKQRQKKVLDVQVNVISLLLLLSALNHFKVLVVAKLDNNYFKIKVILKNKMKFI